MLKFKIYDVGAKRWCEDHQPGTHCFSTYYLDEDGQINEFVGTYVGPIESFTWRDVSEKKYLVFPWIGITDSFNNKIYSGDIISVILVEKEHILRVVYNYNTLTWEFTDTGRRFSWPQIKNATVKRNRHYLDVKN